MKSPTQSKMDILDAARSLINDIDGMKIVPADNDESQYWFGGFFNFNITEDQANIEWPNLVVSLERLKQAIKDLGHEQDQKYG